MTSEVNTVYEQFQRGVEYKHRINYYRKTDENYRIFEGDQWHGLDNKKLPTPVFNVVKPIILYKVSNVMSSNPSIVYKNNNLNSYDSRDLTEVADKLTNYAASVCERIKLDYKAATILQDGAITGDGFAYFYYSSKDPSQDIVMEVIDGTNIYPENYNLDSVQEQRSIIIAFRRNVDDVKAEAKANKVSDIDNISSDDEYNELAGDSAKIEVDENNMCTVLMKLWRDRKTGTIWFKKCVKEFVFVPDTDTGLKYYPIAKFSWEKRKNSFFGIGEVEAVKKNQVYINTLAAMSMLSAMHYAFPKMIYDENILEKPPSNEIGVAIGVRGANGSLKNIVDYITPGNTSGDAYNMINTTIQQTKELSGANDGALGNINPEQASGKAIVAISQQSAIPLEEIKRRYYSFMEDVALIFADFWRNYYPDEKNITVASDDGETETYEIDNEAFNKMMLSVKIDVGASNRYSELMMIQTLDNLLMNGIIPFEWWVELQPETSGVPKAKLKELINQAKEQQQNNAEMQNAGMQNEVMPGFDVNAFVDSLPEDIKRQAIEDPKLLEQLIAEQVSINNK